MSNVVKLPPLRDLKPRLTVIGIGGAGSNAVDNMIASGLAGVDFVAANTDAQALARSTAEKRIQLGAALTEGLGAGSKPEIGAAAAEETAEELRQSIAGSKMVFIAAGMGGGTGTGAATVVARIAKELGVLTVGVVTKPFLFEGTRRQKTAEAGIIELRKAVDTLIVIPNQNLFRIANEKTTFTDAFALADQVLYSGVACIVDLIVKDGLINLDFADVKTVLGEMGSAIMGMGEASGEGRAIEAAEQAINNPILDDTSLKGATGLLMSISGGPELTLFEVDAATNRVRQELDPDANIIFGATCDPSLGDRVRVSIVASGVGRNVEPAGRTEVLRTSLAAPPPIPRPSPLSKTTSAQTDRRDLAHRLTAATPERMPESSPERGLGAQPHSQRDPHSVSTDPQALSLTSLRDHDLGFDSEADRFLRDASPDDPHDEEPLGAPHDAPTPQGRPRRAGGRPHMPSVEDFPVVAQREYHAKTQADMRGAPHVSPKNPSGYPQDSGHSDTVPRKAGFFGWFASGGDASRLAASRLEVEPKGEGGAPRQLRSARHEMPKILIRERS